MVSSFGVSRDRGRPVEAPPSNLAAAVPAARHWSGFGLTVTVRVTDATGAEIDVSGELDCASAQILTAALEHQLGRGPGYVRMDLSGLTFVDAAGLDAILEAHWLYLNRRGTLVLRGVSRRHRRLLQLAGLVNVLLLAWDTDVPRPAVRKTANGAGR